VSVVISAVDEEIDGGLVLDLGGADMVARRIPPVTRNTAVCNKRSFELTPTCTLKLSADTYDLQA
jgi:hypothetical protein